MAKTLCEWIDTEVRPMRTNSVGWLSSFYFFRDPLRPRYSDLSVFLAPADGIVLYSRTVDPDESVVDVKGKAYTLRDAMRDDTYDRTSLVIGIFMTFYDVHINRVPYPGRLSYRLLEPIDTFNQPMLDVENTILDELRVANETSYYLHQNQRMVNHVHSIELGQDYYVLQIADYDVDSILPFELKQNQPVRQGQRFSQIRFGSQVDLILPLSEDYDFIPLQSVGSHVEAGIDPVVAVEPRSHLAAAAGERRMQ